MRKQEEKLIPQSPVAEAPLYNRGSVTARRFTYHGACATHTSDHAF